MQPRTVPPSPQPTKLTLDTDLIHDCVKQRPGHVVAVHRLRELSTAGVVDLAVTRYVDVDVPLPGPVRQWLSQLPKLWIQRTAGVFTLDESLIGGTDGLGAGELVDLEELVMRGGWRPKNAGTPNPTDIRHMHAHYIQGRDVFLTRDEGIIQLATYAAQNGIPIHAAHPIHFLQAYRVGRLRTL